MFICRFRFTAYTRACVIACLCAFLVLGCQGKGQPTSPDLRGTGVESDTLQEFGLVTGESQDGRLIGPSSPSPGGEYLEDEVLVVLHDSASPTELASMLDNRPLRGRKVIKCRWGTIYELIITDGTPVPEMVRSLKVDSRVRFAEPNYILPFTEVPYWPNDPMWESDDDGDDPRDNCYDMWGPAKLAADVVWNDSKGSEDVTVAILDTGIRFDHEDLADNIWINEDEIPDNYEDDDGNGWVDDWWGWDCWDDDNDPWDDGSYANYHGTACAGVAAAVQDNERGLCGVAPGIKVMALKVDLTGSGGLVSTTCLAFEYARINEADICSMSFGTSSYSEILETACDDAWGGGNGLILMASAGNYNTTSYLYPSAYDSVMAIGATVPFSGSLAPVDEARISPALGYGWGSNYGDHLTVMGFGDQYMTTYGGHYDSYWDGYGYPDFFGGTSCACPMSAGVMALVKTYFPMENSQWCWERLEDTADDLDYPGFDIQTGHGRCNALRAVYGSDRYADQEDAFGFVPLALPEQQLHDSIHFVPGNPYEDIEDLYRFTTLDEGFLIIELDIYTWGEDLDIALYSDQGMTNLVEISNIENHYDSSFESIFMGVLGGEEYFLKVYAPEPGGSTTYGLRVHNATNILTVTGESIAQPFVHQQGEKIPFLKLTLDIGYQAILDRLNISKSGTLPLSNLERVQLYQDTEANGEFDENDQLIDEVIHPELNRFVFGNLGMEWTYEDPLVFFVTADISEILTECTIALSLESYKDASTEQGFSAYYQGFPICSDVVSIGTDILPPEWTTTVGAQSAEPYYMSAIIGWNEAVDLQTPPVKYNVYYTDELPFDILGATPLPDVEFEEGLTTDFVTTVWSLPVGVEQHLVVRAEDQVGNEDDNLVIVSCTPLEAGDPSEPLVLNTIPFEYAPFCVDLLDDLLVVGVSYSGLRVYDRSNPIFLGQLSDWYSSSVYDVILDGSHAYCGGSSYFSSVDLSDPSNPFTADYISFSSSIALDKTGDWIYVARSSYDQLIPVKVTFPEDLDLYPIIDLAWAGNPRSVEVYDHWLYVTCDDKGVVVMNLTYPGFPTIINVFGAKTANAMLASGDVLYVVDESTGALTSYDLTTDPADPTELDSTGVGPGGGGTALVIRDNYAYVARETYGLVVFNVTDPADLQLVGDLSLSGILDLATDGVFIYAVSTDSGLNVVI